MGPESPEAFLSEAGRSVWAAPGPSPLSGLSLSCAGLGRIDLRGPLEGTPALTLCFGVHKALVFSWRGSSLRHPRSYDEEQSALPVHRGENRGSEEVQRANP